MFRNHGYIKYLRHRIGMDVENSSQIFVHGIATQTAVISFHSLARKETSTHAKVSLTKNATNMVEAICFPAERNQKHALR